VADVVTHARRDEKAPRDVRMEVTLVTCQQSGLRERIDAACELFDRLLDLSASTGVSRQGELPLHFRCGELQGFDLPKPLGIHDAWGRDAAPLLFTFFPTLGYPRFGID
jgi:hypothetical protein